MCQFNHCLIVGNVFAKQPIIGCITKHVQYSPQKSNHQPLHTYGGYNGIDQ